VSNRFRDGVKVLLDRGRHHDRVSPGRCRDANELVAAYETAAVEVLRFSDRDFGRPSDVEGFAALLDELLLRLEQRETVYVHCYAGIGRTGTLLACLLKRAGATGDPVRLVRAIYDPRALRDRRATALRPCVRTVSLTSGGSAAWARAGRVDPPGAAR
jgi:hypothetical protein